MSNLTYYPDDKTKFNGILILLREPHDEKNISNASGALEGNKIWFQEIISNNVRRTRQESRYRNRFIEMISYCGEREIENIAFANIKLQGGGSNASSEYWEKDRKAAFNAIIEEIGKENLRYIFVLPEIFKLVANEKSVEIINSGIKYKGQEPKRRVRIDGITYYEILHPSRSPRII